MFNYNENEIQDELDCCQNHGFVGASFDDLSGWYDDVKDPIDTSKLQSEYKFRPNNQQSCCKNNQSNNESEVKSKPYIPSDLPKELINSKMQEISRMIDDLTEEAEKVFDPNPIVIHLSLTGADKDLILSIEDDDLFDLMALYLIGDSWDYSRYCEITYYRNGIVLSHQRHNVGKVLEQFNLSDLCNHIKQKQSIYKYIRDSVRRTLGNESGVTEKDDVFEKAEQAKGMIGELSNSYNKPAYREIKRLYEKIENNEECSCQIKETFQEKVNKTVNPR